MVRKKDDPKIYIDPKSTRIAVWMVNAPQLYKAGENIKDTAQNLLPDNYPVRAIKSVNDGGFPVALVQIAHPAGLEQEARTGALRKAAISNGMTMR